MYICSMYMHMYTYSHIDKSAQHACLRSSCNKEQHFPNVQNEKSHSLVDTHTYKGAGRCFSHDIHDCKIQFRSPMAEELAGWWYPIVRMDYYQHDLVDFHCCPVLLWSPCFLAKGLRLLMFLMGTPPSNTAAINAPNSWCLFACVVEFWVNRIFHYVNCC